MYIKKTDANFQQVNLSIKDFYKQQKKKKSSKKKKKKKEKNAIAMKQPVYNEAIEHLTQLLHSMQSIESNLSLAKENNQKLSRLT